MHTQDLKKCPLGQDVLKERCHYIIQLACSDLNLFIFQQFFITLGDDLDYLDGVHTVFAEVVEGFEVLDKLNEAICDDEHRPYQDIRHVFNHVSFMLVLFFFPSKNIICSTHSPKKSCVVATREIFSNFKYQ